MRRLAPSVRGAGPGVTTNDRWIPEVDITNFLTPNLAAELVVACFRKKTVNSRAAVSDWASTAPTSRA